MSFSNDDQRVRDADATNRALRATIGECRDLLRQVDERLGKTDGTAAPSDPMKQSASEQAA